MQKLETLSSERRLDIPIYHVNRYEPEDKSCFINHNRSDYVRDAIRAHEEAQRWREDQWSER